MPGAVGRTSTYALTQRDAALRAATGEQGRGPGGAGEPGLAAGVNMKAGKVTNPAVAETFGLECVPVV